MKLMYLISNGLVVAGMATCFVVPMLGLLLVIFGIWLFVLTLQRDMSKEDK